MNQDRPRASKRVQRLVVGIALLGSAAGATDAPVALRVALVLGGIVMMASALLRGPDEEATGAEASTAAAIPAPPERPPLDARPIEPQPLVSWSLVAGLLIALVVLVAKAESVARLAMALTPYRIEACAGAVPAPLMEGDRVLVERRPATPRLGRLVVIEVTGHAGVRRIGRILALGPDTLAIAPDARVLTAGIAGVPEVEHLVVLRPLALAEGACLLELGGDAAGAAPTLCLAGPHTLQGRALAVVLPPTHWRRLP